MKTIEEISCVDRDPAALAEGETRVRKAYEPPSIQRLDLRDTKNSVTGLHSDGFKVS